MGIGKMRMLVLKRWMAMRMAMRHLDRLALAHAHVGDAHCGKQRRSKMPGFLADGYFFVMPWLVGVDQTGGYLRTYSDFKQLVQLRKEMMLKAVSAAKLQNLSNRMGPGALMFGSGKLS